MSDIDDFAARVAGDLHAPDGCALYARREIADYALSALAARLRDHNACTCSDFEDAADAIQLLRSERNRLRSELRLASRHETARASCCDSNERWSAMWKAGARRWRSEAAHKSLIVESVVEEEAQQWRRASTLAFERDTSRADARILAHAYEHDSRPPADVVKRALAYPVKP